MPILVILSGALIGYLLLKLFCVSRRRARLPPGPRGLPVLGNVREWPKRKEWLTFTHWGQQYGEIVYATLFGQPMLVINSARAAFELLDKRGAIYSDRPSRPMVELARTNRGVGSSRAGPRQTRMRAMLTRTVGTRDAVDRFSPLAETKTRAFILRILRGTDPLKTNIDKGTASIIMGVVYGYDVQEHGEDPMAKLAIDANRTFSRVFAKPFLVDLFPILRRLPEWFPGARFHDIAKQARKRFDDCRTVPVAWVQEQIAAGTAAPSFASQSLCDPNLSPEKMDEILWVASSIFTAGFDTVASTLQTFFLCMTLYPEIQRRAQEEVDRVVGLDRLPVLVDRERMPYMNALILEVLRWGPVLPQGVPHRSTEEDMFDGYLIPKGTFVIANIWGLLHDVDTYAEPMTFNPSRFLAEDSRQPERDPTDFCFGFGRRACPGINFARANLFLACSTALATLDISMAKNSAGDPIRPDAEYTSGLVSQPVEFPCVITARSPKAQALLQGSEE